MRVMVTGGTGFTGSHSVRRFLEAGHRVRLLVRDREKVRRVFDPFEIGFDDTDVVVGDVTDEASVERAMEGCDAVFHSAALVDMRRSMARRVLETNALGVQRVVGGAHRRGLPSIVYVSSASVFFTPGCGPIRPGMPIAEATTAYGRSKAQAERDVVRMQAEGGSIRVSYPVGIVGPHDPGMSDANHALLTFLTQMGVNTSSGFQTVDVRDLAEMHLALLEREEGPCGYVAAGPMLSWPETYGVLESVTGQPIRRISIPGPLFRAMGTVGDLVKRVRDFSFPLTRDAMEYATQWPGCSADDTTRELGIGFRDARTSFADTLRWMMEAGHLEPRQVGRIASAAKATDDADALSAPGAPS
jgi:nucleoside-diphosphate-sugar epimerase